MALGRIKPGSDRVIGSRRSLVEEPEMDGFLKHGLGPLSRKVKMIFFSRLKIPLSAKCRANLIYRSRDEPPTVVMSLSELELGWARLPEVLSGLHLVLFVCCL